MVGAVELAPASAPARPCLAALNLSPIKSPSLAGCNRARRAGSMWLLKMRRLEEEREGGRGEGNGAESREGGGGGREPENKNECDSVRESDNKTMSWGERSRAEMLIDWELHKSQLCLPAEDT